MPTTAKPDRQFYDAAPAVDTCPFCHGAGRRLEAVLGYYEACRVCSGKGFKLRLVVRQPEYAAN